MYFIGEMENFMKRVVSVLLAACVFFGTNIVFGEGFEDATDNEYRGFTINNEIIHTALTHRSKAVYARYGFLITYLIKQ